MSHLAPQIDPKQVKLVANALMAEQLSTLTLHALHGDSDARKSVAKLMRAALEKRSAEILAEVMEGAK